MRADGGAQVGGGDALQLADALAGDADLPPDRFQSRLLAVLQAEPEADDEPVSVVREGGEGVVYGILERAVGDFNALPRVLVQRKGGA